MITLPSKPWKKVKIDQEGEGRYTLTFLSSLKSEAEFKKIINDDLESCLGEHDSLVNPTWKTKGITLLTKDIDSYQRRLVFCSILIENE